MFGRKSRAERLREQTQSSLIPMATLGAVYAGARPVAERFLYDDDLRDNVRVFIESARKILDEVSGDDPAKIVSRLWDDDRLRKQVEIAAAAAQQGSRRARGQKVRSGGGRGRLLFLLLSAGGGFLFLNPRTGPAARKFVGDTISSLTSSGE